MTDVKVFDTDYLKGYVVNENNNLTALLIVSFTVSLIFGVTSISLCTYIIFVLFFESLVIFTYKGFNSWFMNPKVRLGLFSSSLFGWILGRFFTRRYITDPLTSEEGFLTYKTNIVND